MGDQVVNPSPPIVVGLDLSLRATGIAYWDGTADTFEPTCDGDEMHGMVRMDEIARFVSMATNVTDLELVVLEGLAFDAHDNKRLQAQLTGIVRHTLFRENKPFIVVPPATLKKYATGMGNAKKMTMFASATKRLGYDGESFDEADALWLRAIGWHLIMGEPIVELPKAHTAAIDVLLRQRTVPS